MNEAKYITASSSISKEIAKLLIDAEAYKVFYNKPESTWPVWADGRKAPCYCDVRSILSNADARLGVADLLATFIKQEFPQVNVIAGLVTAGVPLATTIADKLKLGLVYVRGEKKKHGTGKQIEGNLRPGSKVLIIDDVLASGGSIIKGVRAFDTESDVTIEGAATLVSFSKPEFANKWQDVTDKNGKQITLATGCTFTDLLDESLAQNLLNEQQYKEMHAIYSN